jgi:enoyl-CoA hydratase/carnithine racemase
MSERLEGEKYQHLRVEDDSSGVVRVTLDRPPANALSIELMTELGALAQELDSREGVRALILRSAVPGMFMAGADLKDMEQRRDTVPYTTRLLRMAYNTWERLPFATIAEIGGHALGGGCELALVCDFRIMARGKGRIGLPEARRGLLAAAGGTQRVTRLLGRARALDIALRGRMFEADEAERIGLVNEACDPEELTERCEALADEFLHLAPLTVAATKRAILDGADLPLSAGLVLEGWEMTLLASTDDVREGMQSFVEKREPRFTGR